MLISHPAYDSIEERKVKHTGWALRPRFPYEDLRGASIKQHKPGPG
jgi:hypothetical protein